MSFMNEYDRTGAIYRFTRANTPNRRMLAEAVDALATWADNNSDGWAYWPKPARAAAKAIALVESTTSAGNAAQERTDATDAEVAAALAPIRSFLTRHGVNHAEVFRDVKDTAGLPAGFRWMTPDEVEWYLMRPVGVSLPDVVMVPDRGLAIREVH